MEVLLMLLVNKSAAVKAFSFYKISFILAKKTHFFDKLHI